MDEQKDNQDLVVGSDGSMNDSNAGEKIQVKTEAQTGESTEVSESVNETSPPPEAEVKNEDTNEGEEIVVKQPPQDSEADDSSESNADTVDLKETASSESFNDTGSTESETDNFGGDQMAAASSTVTPTEISNDSTQSFNSPSQADIKPKENRNNKKLAVIVTVVVALFLAAGAVYMYLSAESNTEESPSTTQTENTNTEAEPATPSDIDQTTQEVDEAINALDDTSDFNEEELSDQNLGL